MAPDVIADDRGTPPTEPRAGLPPESHAPPPRTFDLDRLLAALEGAMADPERAAELGERASAEELHFAFCYELAILVRSGPPASPAALLGLAQRAAGAGAVAWATPVELRSRLTRLAAKLRAAEAWHPERPLWWEPLPAPTPSEQLWARLDEEAALGLERESELAQAFAARTGAPRWLGWLRLIAPEIVDEIAPEMAAAHSRGELRLEPEGVGSTGRRGPQRSDEVAYLAGSEPWLLAAAPRLAVVVQWLRARFASRLRSSIPGLPGGSLEAPATAMLARYPAPSAGYRPHLDNPGGSNDNGRALTLVLYLNPPGQECAGGELALWHPGERVSAPPAALLPAHGGSAVLFDARAVPHQVLPLREGPPRWALTLWLRDDEPLPLTGARLAGVPELTVADVLLAVPDPPLPPGRLLWHELAEDHPGGAFVVRATNASRPRVGVVATVYRGGTLLDAWCEHHFALGFDHLVLIFDHLDQPAEAADVARLRARYDEAHLTLWPGAEVRARRWPHLPAFPQHDELRRWADAGAAAFAVASRQALNASAALAAARAGELGGAALDWLLHLDADELFHLEGDGRGGATVQAHFAAAEAAGLRLLRYVNHELLLPQRPGMPARFKVNPRLAAARFGSSGWNALVTQLRMAQSGPRPYFLGYYNGKSAVAVAYGLAAAGVHGWYLAEGVGPQASPLLAGPSILHLHRPTLEGFRARYLAMAAADWEGPRPFPPSTVEEAAVALLRSLAAAGADPVTAEREVGALYRRLTTFTEPEVDLLEAAGLVLSPVLPPALDLQP